MRASNHTARETLKGLVRSPSETGIPLTPLQCFEAIGGPRFNEFLPARCLTAPGPAAEGAAFPLSAALLSDQETSDG